MNLPPCKTCGGYHSPTLECDVPERIILLVQRADDYLRCKALLERTRMFIEQVRQHRIKCHGDPDTTCGNCDAPGYNQIPREDHTPEVMYSRPIPSVGQSTIIRFDTSDMMVPKNHRPHPDPVRNPNYEKGN